MGPSWGPSPRGRTGRRTEFLSPKNLVTGNQSQSRRHPCRVSLRHKRKKEWVAARQHTLHLCHSAAAGEKKRMGNKNTHASFYIKLHI